MISKNFGTASIFITDALFGHVGVGQEDFPERFSKEFGVLPERMVWMDQVHSATVAWLPGVSEHPTILPTTDGVMSSQKNILLITKTADCVPVLLWNEQQQVIAALHCGWKGFMAGILESFGDKCQAVGLQLELFSAFLGPHLRVQNFEVQQDFIEQVPVAKKDFLEVRDGKSFYNLTEGVISALNSFGIRNIEDCGIDTFAPSNYPSYRSWNQIPVDARPEHYNTFASCIIMT